MQSKYYEAMTTLQTRSLYCPPKTEEISLTAQKVCTGSSYDGTASMENFESFDLFDDLYIL